MTDEHLHGRVANDDWQQMTPPVVEGPFVRPAQGPIVQPVWGHANGLRVGLYPMRGPRGLLRLYAPYLGYPEGRVINFAANGRCTYYARTDPIPGGVAFENFEMVAPFEDGQDFWFGVTASRIGSIC